jgi:type IV secretion system protein VirB4
MQYSSDLLKKLPAVQDKLPPIGRPVSARVTSLEDGRAVLCIEIAGMPFESVSTRVIENHFDGLNRFFAALAMDKGNRLSIHLTFNRRHVSFAQRYTFTSNFVQQLVDKYLDRGFRKRAFFENTFFMSLVLKLDDLEEGIVELEDLGETVMKQLVAYDPEYLTTFERNGMLFSQPYRFMGELINGVEEDIPVTDAPGYELIPNAWLHFGYDVLEIRGEAKSKFATCYDLKDFPNCGWGQLNPLLTLPAEFTLTQTFTCMGTYEAQKALESQANKLKSAGDKATHQIEELQTAQGYISSRELAFGDYHGALVVYGETAQKAIDNGTFVTARSLGECGVRWIKATLSAPTTYFSQIPGATRKPRPMPKSTRNLAAAFSMHNYSSGKRTGNPLGDGSAVMPLHTTAKGMFNFNNHASRLDQDNTGEKVAGHTLMLGATGVGKTTTQLTMLAFLERFDPKIFAMDLDRGMEMFIHVLGGVYFPLRAGEPTGLAPFGLPDTPKNREHCYDLVRACGRDTEGKISAEDEQFIKVAVDTVYRIEDRQQRRFSRLLETIPNTGDNCLAVRLHKWCHATEGRFAWALDNAPDSMIDVASQRRIGFDVTDFLKDNYEPTEPVLAHLFHLKDLMQEKGGLLVTIVEEFWLPAKYPTTQAMILKVLKTGRKSDEFMVLVSQSPEDAINSPIFAAIQQQTATKIYLPNPEAEFESYKRCNLSQREFEELQKLSKESRTFLIKQSNQSVFAMLDLYGFSDELAILSGSVDNVAIWEEIWAEHGPDIDVCLAIFQERRKGKRDQDAA